MVTLVYAFILKYDYVFRWDQLVKVAGYHHRLSNGQMPEKTAV